MALLRCPRCHGLVVGSEPAPGVSGLYQALAGSPPLTEMEERVLALLSDGPTHEEIAERLGITVRTSKFHIANLRLKFGGLSRLQLCLLAALRRLDAAASCGCRESSPAPAPS